MKETTFTKSLMEFNKRVLWQGTPNQYKTYSMNELKQLIFFNSIFIGNTDEIFERHDFSSVIHEFIISLSTYIKNIEEVIQQLMELRRDIVFSREDSFERRFSMFSEIDGLIIKNRYQSIEDVDFNFKSRGIYFIGVNEDDEISISYVDEGRELFKSPMGFKGKDRMVYWKTDECIRDHIENKTGEDVIAVRVVTSNSNPELITKVEFNGDYKLMKRLSPLFGKKALIIANPYLYLNDIEQMITSNISHELPKQVQRFKMVNLKDLMHKDRIVEYPMDSFEEYLWFLRSAAFDPEVKSIYMTLYRIGKDPAIFYILREAVRRGIKVCVNIELHASGESINRMWLEELEEAGIKVTTYASGELKVHCKLTLVKFNNGRSIAQIGTGNYHTKTTVQYTDLSLITGNENICHQVEKVFDLLDDEKDCVFNKNLLVTRYNARQELIKLIDHEADKGNKGYICIKCNALDDGLIKLHLDQAAKCGCNIDLIIRGVCTWIPDQLGDNVNIKSIVWDKLEHSRVYCFGRKNPAIYIGSLDLVTKKIDERIETLVLVTDPEVEMKMAEYLNRYITNTEGSWKLLSNGEYVKE